MKILTALGFLAMVGCGGEVPETMPTGVDGGDDTSVVVAPVTEGGATDPDGMAPLVDAGTDTGGIYEGPGTLALTWTVNGQPPATGCSTGSVVVEFGIGPLVTVDCTTGSYTTMTFASTYGFTASLVVGGSTRGTVHQTVAIRSGAVTTVVVDL